MAFKKFSRIVDVVLVCALLASASFGQSREDQEKKGKNKPSEKTKTEEKRETSTKLFQLNEIVIDVVEKIRDIELPNMVVVKPELFPMSIGTTVDTALERQAGVDVQRIQEVGTAMDDDSIKVRGFGTRRVKFLRDGRLLNTSGAAGGYFVDFTMIPLNNVDRVEIVKGVGDARYGNVLGGIINLVPRRIPSDRPVTELQASWGSFNTGAVNLFHAAKPGAFEYSLSAGITGSDGYLRNGDVSQGNVELHLGYDFPFKGRVTADISYARIRKGFIVANRTAKSPDEAGYGIAKDDADPASDGEFMYGGMGAYPEDGSWWKKSKWLFNLGYEQAFGESGLLRLSAWRNQGEREAWNTRAALDRTFHKLFYDDRCRGLSGRYRHLLGRHVLAFGVDFSDLRDDGEKNYEDDFRALYRIGSYVRAKNLEFYAMGDFKLLDGKLVLTPGVRFMSYKGVPGPSGVLEGIPEMSKSGAAPSLKATWNLDAENLVYVSLSRALRMPTAPEYYWHYSPDAGVFTGGLPFESEDGFMIQGGWRGALPTGTRLEISPYYYDIKNYIQFDLINYIAYNIDKARIYGAEVEASHVFGGGWSSFANATLQKSRTEGDMFKTLFVDAGDQGFDNVPGLPGFMANAGIQFKTRSDISLAFFAHAVSDQKVITNDNTLTNTAQRVRSQNGYVRFDAEARLPVMRNITAAFFIRNILDADYQERYGFPSAGRTAGISLKASF